MITQKEEIQKQRAALIYDFDKILPENRAQYEHLNARLLAIEYYELEEKYKKLLAFAKRIRDDNVHYYGLDAERLLEEIGEKE